MNHTLRTARDARNSLTGLAASLLVAFGPSVQANPTGGTVSAGGATISGGAGTTTINQSTQNVAINWQSFSIGQGEAVKFVQPNSGSVALNRVLGADPSSILGSLSANGKVFLVNPNGILFAQGAQVNVAALVASTRNITDGDFMAGNYRFAGTGGGTVVNQGSINADGGYVALLGANVSNQGVISARLGTVALAAGNAMTLDVAGDGLLSIAVSQGAVNALAENGGLIQADGGQVLLTAQSASSLLQSAVNNTGVIQAQSVENHNGTIRLLGDMQSGTVSVGGTLDVSGTGTGQTGGNVTVTGHHVGLFDGQINASGDAGGGTVLVGGGYQGNNPAVQNASATYMSANSTINVDALNNGNGGTAVLWSNDSTRADGSITARGGVQGGDGGLIETSGHWLDVWGVNINASAPNGKGGMWLLDPADVTISAAADTNGTTVGGVFAPNPGVNSANVNAGALQVLLNAGTSVTITTTNIGVPGTGAGDITVNSALTWTPAVTSTLTLNAVRDVNINQAVTATNGNLVVCCGRDVNVNAAITTVGGSVLLGAGNNINMNAPVSTTNGNITFCAGNNVNVNQSITLVNSGSIPAQSLGLPLGLVLSAGNAGTGPGPASGTVIMNPLFPASITRSAAPLVGITIDYNPTSYTTPTNYAPNFILVGAVTLNQRMLVYPEVATKTFDGTTTATVIGLKGAPANVSLAGPGTANFDTPDAGLNKLITFSGFTLAGTNAADFALPGTAICCTPNIQRTTGNITAAPILPGGIVSAEGTSPLGAVLAPLALLPVFAPGPGMNFEVAGIAMPPIPVAEAPVEEVVAPVQVAVPVPMLRPLPPRRTRF